MYEIIKQTNNNGDLQFNVIPKIYLRKEKAEEDAEQYNTVCKLANSETNITWEVFDFEIIE